MVELNQRITWYPERVKDGQFGKWLTGRPRLVDLPESGYPDSGSKKSRPGLPAHRVTAASTSWSATRPANCTGPIDELTRPSDPTGRSTMRRIPDMLDVWIRFGIPPCPGATVENLDWFQGHYPGDSSSVHRAKTRGWFTHCMRARRSALLAGIQNLCGAWDCPWFRWPEDEQVALRNYQTCGVFDRDGSDAMQWFSGIARRQPDRTEQGIRDGVHDKSCCHVEHLQLPAAPKVGTPGASIRYVLDHACLAQLAVLRDDLSRFTIFRCL